jgi:hypothetical protein
MLLSLLKDLLKQGKARPAPAVAGDLPFHDRGALISSVAKKAGILRELYLDWPVFVHMETIALCNAACDFCPYPSLERKGERMPDELIEKIIRDLSDIPPDVRFQLAPYKVSEPFLEPRLFEILELVNARLPNADISMISNASPLTEKKIDQLCAVRNVSYLTISLNYDNAEEYESVMKLPFDRTLRRLDVLHQRKVSGDIPFPVRLSRVSDSLLTDTRFYRWAQSKYPAFVTGIIPRNDWLGEMALGDAPEIPDVSCHRWFDMSITVTGKVAMCCMDGSVRYPKGDVTTSHVLEIYNQPHLRRLREQLISRRVAADPCNRCTYLSG